MPIDPTIAAAGINLLGGLFKGKSQGPFRAIGETIEAADKWGINRLTALGSTPAGTGFSRDAPPLASLSILTDAIADKYGEDGKARREHNRLQNELLTLEVQRARTLSRVAPAQSVAAGGGITGGRNTAKTGSFTGAGHDFTKDNAGLTPGREGVVDPQRHASGIIQYNNALTGPVTLLGDDGEPFMEYLQVPIVGGWQVMNNWAKHVAAEYVAPAVSAITGKPVNQKRTREYYMTLPAPFGRDAYGRPLPKPESN